MILPGLISAKPSGASYAGPLDIQGSAVVAYSQRALAAAWVTNAITIREDGGDTTMSFTTAVNNEVNPEAIAGFLSGAAFPQTGAVADLSDTITLVDATGVKNGQIITGANIPALATVIDISGAPVIQISAAATGTNAAEVLTFYPNGFVTTWFDQSGNTKNAAQATAAKQPGWLSSGTNSKPALIGAPDNVTEVDLVTTSSITLTNPTYTAFIVLKITGAGNDVAGFNGQGTVPDGDLMEIGFSGTSPNGTFVVASDDGWNVDSVGGFADAQVTGGAWIIYEAAWALGSLTIAVNGVALTPSGSYDGDPVGALSAPLVLLGSDTTFPTFTGNVSEFILYDSVLSAPTRTSIRQNIATYYDITLP